MRIVPAFDELKNNWARLSWCTEACAVEQFTFEGGEEAFTHGIVKTITDRAHGRADAGFAAAATKGQGSVLASMIGMVDDILGMALLDSHLQSLQDQLRAQVSCHGPANDPAAPGVEHDGQIEKPSPGWDIGDIRHPEFIRAAGCKVALDQIGGWLCIWPSLGGVRRFGGRLTPRKSAAFIRRATRLRPTCRPCSANSAWMRGAP